MTYVNSSATNNDTAIEPKTQEILSQIATQSVQQESESQCLSIKSAVKTSLKRLEELLDSPDYAKDASELGALEKEIVRKTDRLAGLLIGYKMQQSIESEELKKETLKFIEACPKKLKNQGRREVKIHPLRGEEGAFHKSRHQVISCTNGENANCFSIFQRPALKYERNMSIASAFS
jgi:hypothetical protein